jgi:hypothetical protein
MKSKNFVLILLSILLITTISASNTYCVTAEVSDITPSSIKINEEFTIGIQIENCGTKIPEQVSFELINPPTGIEIKEPLIINISKLYYGNSERFINYHMKTTTDTKPGTYVIKTRLSYGDSEFSVTNNYNITFNVIGDKAKLNIASVKTTPVLAYEGETLELTLRIENFGEGTANAIKVYADHPFQGIKESFIGTLNANEDGPAIFTFIANQSGEFKIPIKINYKDDFGENEVVTQISISILKKEVNWILIIIITAIILIAIWGIINYTKLKKSKNKIIHQLLSGKQKEEKITNPKIVKEKKRIQRKNISKK